MAPPLVFDFLGIVFAAILYGLYCLIFALYWRIQLKRTDRRNGLPLYALTANFILCTMYLILSIILVQFNITDAVLNEHSLESASSWLDIAINSLYTAIDFISQLILLYRCWILWHQPLVMVIPCFLSLAFLVIALTTLSLQIRGIITVTKTDSDWYYSSVTAFFFLSLAVNALVTVLIVYRIITVYNEIRGVNSNQGSVLGHRDISPLISILIESGLVTFVAQVTQTIMYKAGTVAFTIVGPAVVMLYGISTTVVLVRVESGVSYEYNSALATVNSMNSGRPIELWKADPSNLNDAHPGSSFA